MRCRLPRGKKEESDRPQGATSMDEAEQPLVFPPNRALLICPCCPPRAPGAVGKLRVPPSSARRLRAGRVWCGEAVTLPANAPALGTAAPRSRGLIALLGEGALGHYLPPFHSAGGRGAEQRC